MTDETEHTTPPARPQPTRRPRRFRLPDDHHPDERTSERIEAFLEGPPRPQRRRGPQRRRAAIAFETATEWDASVRREEVRVRRYGRPVTVVVVEVAAIPPADPAVAVTEADFTEPVAGAIRAEARETDHVVRDMPGRFRMLLPETDEHDAHRLVDRVAKVSRERLNGHGGDLRLRIGTATRGHAQSIADTLAEAERRLAD